MTVVRIPLGPPARNTVDRWSWGSSEHRVQLGWDLMDRDGAIHALRPGMPAWVSGSIFRERFGQSKWTDRYMSPPRSDWLRIAAK